MRRLAFLLLAAASAPALAQHGDHGQHHPAPAPAPIEAAPAKPAPDPHAGHHPPPAAAVPDPHAGHHPAPAAAADPHAGHRPAPAAAAPDPHAGHGQPPAAAAPDPHAAHRAVARSADPDQATGADTTPPTAPPPPAALAGPANAADLVYGAEEMAEAREMLREEHGSIETFKLLIDQAEAKIGDGRDGYGLDAQAWYGGDIDKIWLKSEGEGRFGEKPEKVEVQALWSHAVDPWFDLQIGLRHDFRPDPERTHLVLGAQGLAPFWFEVDGALFLSDKGEVTARAEAEYDLRLTQKLILQPRVELELSAQAVPEIGLGSGLTSGEIGARLRYEIIPEFAPYVGVEYERAFGGTADFARAQGEDAGGLSLVLGVRTWF